jgi:PII-like signaling protein
MDEHHLTGGRTGTGVTMMLGVRDRAHHRSLVTATPARTRSSLLRGATAFAGWSGAGTSGKSRRSTVLPGDVESVDLHRSAPPE